MPVLLRALLAGRLLLLLASAGGVLAALLMFLVGFAYLFHAAQYVLAGGHAGRHPSTYVMGSLLEAADAFLFGIVFVFFAYAVAIGFVFQLPERFVRRLPSWMRVESGELRRLLYEMVLVGLIVIFAAIALEEQERLDWADLVLPVAVMLLTVSSRLLRDPRPRPEQPKRDAAVEEPAG